MNLKDLTAILAVVGALLVCFIHMASCEEAKSKQKHERQLACINQGIYCGQQGYE